jgi:hypothetical protein
MPIARLRLLIAEFAFYILQQHEPIALDNVTFVAGEKVIICTRCCTAVPVTGLDTYLRASHHVPPKVRRMAIARFDSVPAAQSFKDLVPRYDRSVPLSYLSPPAPGFVVHTVQRERQLTGIRCDGMRRRNITQCSGMRSRSI